MTEICFSCYFSERILAEDFKVGFYVNIRDLLLCNNGNSAVPVFLVLFSAFSFVKQ